MTTPPLWPSTLPLYPNEVSGQPQPGVAAFEPQEGLPMKRPRLTATVDVFQVGFAALSLTQMATLRTFHRTTLGHGSLRFAWVHPITGAFREMDMSPPSEASAGGVSWRTTFTVTFLDVLPAWAADVEISNGAIQAVP